MLDKEILDPPAGRPGELFTPFACRTDHGKNAAWVRLAGDLDIATSPRLEQALIDAQRRASVVVVDLRRVAFADSSTVHALIDADARARRDGSRLVVLRGPPDVDRMFTLSGGSDAVEIVDFATASWS